MPLLTVETDTFTASEAERVRHFTGMKCWCHGADGQPDPNCRAHENGGWLYVDEKPIDGLITGVSHRKELLQSGIFLPGDCIFSPLTGDVVSEMDKIVFTWPLPYGSGDALVRGGESSDALYYEAVKNIICLDEDGVKYAEGTDFRFVGKTIEWVWEGRSAEAKKPRFGTRYAVKYMAYLEWVAFFPPETRISRGDDLGAKVFLRRRHLWEGA